MISVPLNVRLILPEDRHALTDLLPKSSYLHQHFDWLALSDYLDVGPTVLAAKGEQLIAAMSCPQLLLDSTWLRLFAVRHSSALEHSWDITWNTMQETLRTSGCNQIAAMPVDNWFRDILIRAGFTRTTDVIFLERELRNDPQNPCANTAIRRIKPADLDRVLEIDNTAFQIPWQHSKPALQAAIQRSSYSTVYMLDDHIAGYQISTSTALGAHLARLAVDPIFQRKGFAADLVKDGLNHFFRLGFHAISVNTQLDNIPSQKLYKYLGFKLMQMYYPVYSFQLSPTR